MQSQNYQNFEDKERARKFFQTKAGSIFTKEGVHKPRARLVPVTDMASRWKYRVYFWGANHDGTI